MFTSWSALCGEKHHGVLHGRATGHPMRFIGQIALDPALVGEIAARMAYLFMEDSDTQDGWSWDTESCEMPSSSSQGAMRGTPCHEWQVPRPSPGLRRRACARARPLATPAAGDGIYGRARAGRGSGGAVLNRTCDLRVSGRLFCGNPKERRHHGPSLPGSAAGLEAGPCCSSWHSCCCRRQ